MLRLVCALTLAACVVAAALGPSTARANGDLASDVLLQDTLFVSTQAPSAETVQKLRGVIEEARRAGQPVRVALIHSQQDLATVGNLFGYPSEYAEYLSRQVSNPAEPGARGNREALLVVMPAGYGTANVPPAVDGELRGVELPADADPDELAEAAGYGVQQLSGAAGHPIRATFEKPEGQGGGALAPILIVVALTAVIALLFVLRMRTQGEPERLND